MDVLPFPDAERPGKWHYYSVWLRRDDIMANWYHFRPVRGGCEQVTAHTLLARFANNIFLCMQTDHFGLEKERYLWDDDGEARMTSMEEIDEWLRKNRESTDPKRRSKSSSPTKRTRSEALDEGDELVDEVVDEEERRFGKESWISTGTVDSGIGVQAESDLEGESPEDDNYDDSLGCCRDERRSRFEGLKGGGLKENGCLSSKRSRGQSGTIIHPSIEKCCENDRQAKKIRLFRRVYFV